MFTAAVLHADYVCVCVYMFTATVLHADYVCACVCTCLRLLYYTLIVEYYTLIVAFLDQDSYRLFKFVSD